MISYYLKPSRIFTLSIVCFLALLATSSWTSEPVAMVSAAPAPVVESRVAQGFALSSGSEVDGDSLSQTMTDKRSLDRRQHVPGTGTGVGGDYNKGDPNNRK
ncbi:hypothetical protein BGX20_002349 [Mortierella sp. AD010]|nr:hypothetical protein BGX20_002349 [Mortierella sp. AD010]